MKNTAISFLFLAFLLLLGCYPYQQPMLKSNVQPSKNILTQQYSSYKTFGANSVFGVSNRKIEFEYRWDESCEHLLLIQRITTGFDEGELREGFRWVLDDTEFLFQKGKKTVREYTESRQTVSGSSSTTTETVWQPGGIDVVVTPEGKHETIHRAGSFVQVPVPSGSTNVATNSNSQIFNELEYEVPTAVWKRQLDSEKLFFRVYFQRDSMDIYPYVGQVRQLKQFLYAADSN